MSGNRVCVGAIAGAYGTGGEVRLRSFCADPASIAGYGPLWCDNTTQSHSVSITHPIKGGVAARLSGVGSREQADCLRGTLLYADRSALPDTEDGEFYHSDLIGLEVLDVVGTCLGLVYAIQDFGAGDILEIERVGSRETVLIPFTEAVVPTVDLTAGHIVIDPTAELLPDLKNAE